MKKNIPNATRNRFPQYLRVLQELKERGIDFTFLDEDL